MHLYTKNGAPLAVHGDRVYNPDGVNFGYVREDRVFGLDGRYRGTIVNGRLIYRSTHSARISGPRAQAASRAGSARAHRAGTGAWGDEPNIEP
jgi:4-fold beta flower protein